MSLIKQFKNRLEKLIKRRLNEIYQELEMSGVGQPLQYDKKKIKKDIDKLVEEIPDILVKTEEIKREWKRAYKSKKLFRATGWGDDSKKKKFQEKYEKEIPYRNCAYVFYKGNIALYVGRTSNGKGRPSNHFEENKCNGTTKIWVLPTSKSSYAPRLECLAYHILKPTKNKIAPSKGKYKKKCPICKTQKKVKLELKEMLL